MVRRRRSFPFNAPVFTIMYRRAHRCSIRNIASGSNFSQDLVAHRQASSQSRIRTTSSFVLFLFFFFFFCCLPTIFPILRFVTAALNFVKDNDCLVVFCCCCCFLFVWRFNEDDDDDENASHDN